jgi:hypothetical protein
MPDCGTDVQAGMTEPSSSTAAGNTAAESSAVCERLRADREWLATQGVGLSQFGPDPVSGKVRIYLARYSEAAHQALLGRYGSTVVVDTEPRQWRRTEAPR